MSTKVLIVDDEAEFASTLAERLALRNYDVKAVFNAEDAITTAQSDPPDVVLLDLRMPGIGGLEVLKTIKRFDPTIEVIIITGQPETEGAGEEILTGPFDCIIKPVDISKLIVKINNANEKRNLSKHS
jgi:two-component system, OmpR family, response regulator